MNRNLCLVITQFGTLVAFQLGQPTVCDCSEYVRPIPLEPPEPENLPEPRAPIMQRPSAASGLSGTPQELALPAISSTATVLAPSVTQPALA